MQRARSRVRTTSVNMKNTFTSLQAPKHLSMMDKSIHSLPRHPLAAALGLGSWGIWILCGCECVSSPHPSMRCIHTNVNTRTRPSEVTHMDPICPLSDAVCMGAPVEPLPARIFTLQVFWRGACGPMCQKGLRGAEH